MVEVTVDPKTLEDAILKVLPTLFPSPLGTASDPAVEFYNKFHQVADDHDRDFLKKCNEDLNNTLIFAGLFSAVTSTFIIDIQSELQEDFQEMSYALLKILASTALGNIPTGAAAAFPEWTGPDSTIVHVQAVLYASLSATLLAALIAILGKQWLNRYASVEHGSIIDRGRHRKRKMDGIVVWRFGLVMDCLPLTLQAALLLFGYALSNYLFFINKAIAGVVIGFTSLGVLFYLLIISAATFSYNCPFQTPISLILRFLIHFDYKKFLGQTGDFFASVLFPTRPRPGNPPGVHTPNGNNTNNHTVVVMAGPPLQPTLPLKHANWDGYVLDSNCIARMFEMSVEVDATMAIARYIPEIVWHTRIRDIPLGRLYDTVFECFDRSSGHPILKPASRDKAYLSARALLHVGIQRKCFGDGSDHAMFESVLARYKTMGSERYGRDPDLGSTLSIIDYVFTHPVSDNLEPARWEDFSFTITHHTWMAHILLHYAWDVLRRGRLPKYIKKFVLHSFRLEPVPPTQIIADCLFIIGLILGIGMDVDDLSVTDKSPCIDDQITKIYEELTKTFSDRNPIPDKIKPALEAMELIAPLSYRDIPQKSYRLFEVIMEAPGETKWDASRLAMHGAYKRGGLSPKIDNPDKVLTFLEYHFKLATEDNENQDEPIQHALCALSCASEPSIQALKDFDSTKASFVRGICHVFQDNRPFQLREVALLFLALISDKWFETPNTIMTRGEMRKFCAGWASFVDSAEPTNDVQEATLAVFFGMIGSPHWCGHMALGKWRLLERFTPVLDDPRSLRCLNNPELMDEIKAIGDPALVAHWLKVLWLKYTELNTQVQNQLKATTVEFIGGGRRTDLAVCLSAINLELKRAKSMDTDLVPTSVEHNLAEARDVLTGLMQRSILSI